MSVTARAEIWITLDDSMLPAVEQAIQRYLALKEAMLKLLHAIMASKWLFQSKRTLLADMATDSNPSLQMLNDESNAKSTATNVASCNSKHYGYFKWAQSVLYAVLLDSFQESDP